ncbi:MAG: hypothetical protein RSD36_06230 [Terrisporobacter sp.]|uniref:hypothetical protein n=1 Tax=Terrisporobacter sp. TaxID=1965305 RepID=UPI002FC83617
MNIIKLKINKKIYIFILCSLIYNLLLSLMYMNSDNINTLIINIYSNVDLLRVENVIKIILWMLPQIIMIRYFGNFFEENLLSNTTVIFTRTSKRSYFLLKNVFSLFLNIIIVCMIQVVSIIFVSIVIKVPVSINFMTFLIICRIILYYFLLLLIINGFSVLWKSINGVFIVMLVEITMVYLSGMLLEYYQIMIKYIPVNIGIISINNFGMGLNNIESIIYCLVYVIFFLIVTIFLFWKKEFLN